MPFDICLHICILKIEEQLKFIHTRKQLQVQDLLIDWLKPFLHEKFTLKKQQEIFWWFIIGFTYFIYLEFLGTPIIEFIKRIFSYKISSFSLTVLLYYGIEPDRMRMTFKIRNFGILRCIFIYWTTARSIAFKVVARHLPQIPRSK